MTLAELQALIMAQAVAKLERLQGELQVKQTAQEQAPERDPARPWRVGRDEYLQEAIDEQSLLIAKLTYQHEREQGELVRLESLLALERARLVSEIEDREHVTKHRDGVLQAFVASVEAMKQGNEIQKAGLAAIAEAIQGRAPQ